MDTKEVLDKAIEDVKREKNWLVREFYYIEHLESAAKLAQAEDERHRDLGIKEMRAFERKAARAESKIYNFSKSQHTKVFYKYPKTAVNNCRLG